MTYLAGWMAIVNGAAFYDGQTAIARVDGRHTDCRSISGGSIMRATAPRVHTGDRIASCGAGHSPHSAHQAKGASYGLESTNARFLFLSVHDSQRSSSGRVTAEIEIGELVRRVAGGDFAGAQAVGVR